MSLADEVAGGLDGLSQLRMLMASGRKPGILVTLDFDLVEVEAGKAVFAGTPGKHVYNPIGTVHGGYAATLLDSAVACAIHTTMAKGEAYTTLELKLNVGRPITTAAGLLSAEGRVIHRGRTIATSEGQLKDRAGKLYAHATTTCMIFPAKA